MSTVPRIRMTGEPPEIVESDGIPPHERPSRDPTVWDPIVVEVDDLQGEPQVVDWLGPRFVVERPVNALPRAELPVILHDGWLINAGTREEPIVVPLEDALADNAIIRIRTARPSPELDHLLFQGYLDTITRTAQIRKETLLTCVHLADDIDQDPDKTIHGQLWVNLANELKVCGGLPAVFNPERAPNCRKDLVWVDDPEHEGDQFPVPVWTHPHDSNAQRWTWARVFLFLIYWGRKCPDLTLGSFPHELRERNLVTLIRENGWHLIDPDDLGGLPHEPWGRLLLATPSSHALEGMSWLTQALTWTCARSGIGWLLDTWIRTESEGQEQIEVLQEGFRFFATETERRTRLKLPSKHYRTDDKPWTKVLQEANVGSAAVIRNFGSCANEIIGSGGARRYEVTVELRPGWTWLATRTPQVDVDPSDDQAVADALAEIGQEDWLKRYDRRGSDFRDHWDVLRLWIVADYKDFSDTHGRPHPPWTAELYEPLDLADLELGEVQSEPGGPFLRNQNVVRPRPLERCLTGHTYRQTYPPIVQLNYQSGAAGKWWEPPGGISVLRRRLGVFVEIPDLTGEDLREPSEFGGGAYNFPEAYIRGLLRIRVTGVIKGDTSADTLPFVSISSLSQRRRGRLVHKPELFAYAIRDDRNDGTSGGNSIFKGTGRPVTEEFEEDYHWLMTRAMERLDRVRIAGPVELPGLRFWWSSEAGTRGYRPGDEVEAIVAEDEQHTHDLPLRASMRFDFSIISKMTWRYDPGDGETRAPQLVTALTLEDPAAIVGFGRRL